MVAQTVISAVITIFVFIWMLVVSYRLYRIQWSTVHLENFVKVHKRIDANLQSTVQYLEAIQGALGEKNNSREHSTEDDSYISPKSLPDIICTNCSITVRRDADFCTSCGHKV